MKRLNKQAVHGLEILLNAGIVSEKDLLNRFTIDDVIRLNLSRSDMIAISEVRKAVKEKALLPLLFKQDSDEPDTQRIRKKRKNNTQEQEANNTDE